MPLTKSFLGFALAGTRWTESSEGAVNTAVTLTRALEVGRVHFIKGIEIVLLGASPSADLEVELRQGSATGTVLWRTGIGNAAAIGTRSGHFQDDPIELDPGLAALLILPAPGAGAYWLANMKGITR